LSLARWSSGEPAKWRFFEDEKCLNHEGQVDGGAGGKAGRMKSSSSPSGGLMERSLYRPLTTLTTVRCARNRKTRCMPVPTAVGTSTTPDGVE
jgi:hypothetical protein